MEGNECTPMVSARELRALIDLKIVRRPVSGKHCNRRLELVAVANHCPTVAAIFRCQHALLLRAVVITGRPSVVGTFFQYDHLLRWKLEALPGRVELWPALTQLVATMLGDVQASRLVEVESFTVANADGIPFLCRE